MDAILHGNMVVAYRLEDKYGNSPYYIDSRRNHFNLEVYPDSGEWMYAFLNPCRFLEQPYKKYIYKMNIYQYLLYPNVHVSNTGEVSFRKKDVLSKDIARRAERRIS